MIFQYAPMWMQLLGLPPYCRMKTMAKKIGESLGEVIDAAAFELPDKSIIVKVKVLFDISHKIKKEQERWYFLGRLSV